MIGRRCPTHVRAVSGLALLILGILVVAGCGGSSSGSGSASGETDRWDTASRIANSLLEDGAARPVAECAGERAIAASSARQVVRLGDDAAYAARRSSATRSECERSFHPSGAAQPTTPIVIDPEASPESFANGIDTICAIDFDEALRREAAIGRLAAVRRWSEDHAQAVYHYDWASSQAETARLVGNLGTPPANPELVDRWRQNVALRGRLFRAQGDAWRRGEEGRALAISERVMSLKARADSYGRTLGLRVCTSN